MPKSRFDKQYIPSVPSPLNPDTRHDSSRAKKHRRPKPVAKQTPSLSYAQHILRAKAAEAWRSEALRRAYHHPRSERDMTDSPLSRAALDMHRDCAPAAAVDLEHSLGLEPLSPAAAAAEKPSFGLLQPFTVDLSAATSEYRPQTDEARLPYKGLARKTLLVLCLLCLSFCLLPSMRYRASFRQGMVVRVKS